jgi:hypothetical protein
MNIDAIPSELKARRQWVIWKEVVADGAVTKPPFNPNNPNYKASVTDPATWGTFEDAVRVFKNNPSLVSGIGFVFTAEDEYFGVDVDDERKVAPEHLPARKALVAQLIENLDTYTETSPSGNGLHMIGKGRLPIAGHRSTKLQFEIYQEERYFTITGNVFGDRKEITDQQEFINALAQTILQQRERVNLEVSDTDVLRRLDLTDEEVIRLATNFHPNFAPRFNAQTGCGPGEWSDTFIAVVGLVERFTGSVSQVQRIIFNSPMVLQAPNSSANETRLDKAKRNFGHVLARVRQNNSGLMEFAAHGRQVWDNIQAAKAEKAKKIAEEILARAEETFSANGVNLLKAFPIEPKYLELTPPPGIVGRFCEATAAACYNPYMKFSIPATLATLAGILARSYKLPSGNGLNVNFILAAATSAGKTQTMTAWEGFLHRAVRQLGNSLNGPARLRLIKAAASSIQGIFPDFMASPSAVWFISECASQLKQMSDPKSTTDGQLRDAYNDLYDASSMGKIFSPPRSVANRKADLEPIENLAVSTYWTTTTSKFDVFNDDAQDGFLSRVIIIRHAGSAGAPIPEWEINFELADDLHQVLVTRLAAAKQFDETFALSAQDGARLITVVSTSEVEGMAWAFRQISERIKNASLDGSMPMAYTAVSRLPVTAMRLAGVLAVMENPYSPAITPDQFQWAFGYLLQNTAALLSDMDRGELGASMSKDMDVVVREIKRTMRKTKLHGVKKGELVHALRFLKPFKDDRTSPGDAVRRTLTEMMGHGMIIETTMAQPGKGRPGTIICPTDDDIWMS